MPALVSLLFLAVVQFGLCGISWSADAPIFGTFALFEVDKDWGNLSGKKDKKEERRQKPYWNQPKIRSPWMAIGLTG